MPAIRRLAPVLLVLLALVLPAAPAPAAPDGWRLDEEHWYVLEINGARAGWMHAASHRDDAGRRRASSQQRLSVSRGQATISVSMEETFIEDASGALLEMRLVQDASRQVTESVWRFDDEGVEVVQRAGERETVTRKPRPRGDWLTPTEVDALMEEAIAGDRTELRYSVLQPQAGLTPLDVTTTRIGRRTIETADGPREVTTWRTVSSAMPVPILEMRDAAGTMVRSELEMGGLGTIVSRLATREAALAPAAGPAPELFASTFAEPDRPIDRPHRTTTATFRVTATVGELPDLPEAGAQRVERTGPTSAVLRVTVHDAVPATPAEQDDARYLGSDLMVDPHDPLVRKLARRAVEEAGVAAPADRAEALRAYVASYIAAKDLDTAFASASETARMRRGDCSEHAMLLCAMLRAEGIPARVATGLVYADRFAGERDIFGWHMWTQALVDDRWIDLDATLPVPYSAAHILTGTSSMETGALSLDLASMMSLLGNVEIEVLDVGYE